VPSVYVVRHAVAEDRDGERWPDDAKRPLTTDGEASFRRAARGLKTIVPHVDVVLSSPYARAWRTAEILYEEAGWPAPKRAELLEAWRAPSDGLELVQETKHESIALVGHEPGLSRLVSLLLTGDDAAVQIDLKKGGVVRVDDNVLRWYATPKILRSLA
jgi:phosphohistidine phosphatase